MSTATKAVLDVALAAHIADECDGALVNGYVIQAEYVDMVDRSNFGWFRMTPPEQSLTTTIGLTHYLAQSVAMTVSRQGH